MISRKIAALSGLHFFLFLPVCIAQTPGQNINMVSGTSFPTGDPYLQRQNEPAIAASSRNPSRLLAAANDYRSINIPAPPGVKDETGDAWLGVFKSFDAGATWQSNLLPGYPQDVSPEGLASPLHGFTTGADPVVRAGTSGMFYFSGIAFDRVNDNGVIFVARYMDLANKENGDAIAYLDAAVVDHGSSKLFIDKPWIAVDIPRGTATCTIRTTQDGKPVAQTIPAGTIYVSYSAFIGGDASANAEIRVSRSTNCGQTWTKLGAISNPPSESGEAALADRSSVATQVNQGSSMVIDPQTGDLYVAWRAFVNKNLPDAILISKLVLGGSRFTEPTRVQVLPRFDLSHPSVPAFFDQPLTTSSFRSNGYPSLAIDGSGRLYLAWSQRGFAQGGDARIVLKTSQDGVTWPTLAQPIDNEPVRDDLGNSFDRGDQFMPSLTFSEGKLMALYYDQRFDHTVGEFTPNKPFVPDLTGSFYKQGREVVGDLPGSPNLVFTPFIADFGLKIRHTIETRISQADPGPSPSFTSVDVSQYKFGTLGNEQPAGAVTHLQQLQLNPPNLPMFQGGTVPFIGDYIDIAGRTFRAPGETNGAGWQFNTAATQSPVHYATWTSNQDVRPPADFNWAHYTPPGPGCIPGQEGDKNQNIYFSRITQGLAFSSPQLSKPLSTTLQRAFVLDLFNGTKLPHTFRLTIANQPAGGAASFAVAPRPLPEILPPPVTFVDLTLPPLSGATRSVFATSTDPSATIEVTATELVAVGGLPFVNGLTGAVVLNSDPTVPALDNPDGSPGDINVLELYTPNLSNPNLSNPNLSNPNLSNPNLSNPNLSNPNLSNPNLSNPNLSNPNLSNANVSNPNLSNPNLSNPNLSNPNLSNAPVSDITYSVTNKGNTNTAYQVRLVKLGNVSNSAHIQLIGSKTYLTPIGDNCKLLEEPTNEIVANITSPTFIPVSQIGLNTSNAPGTDNATLHLAPGETATITIRGYVDLATMKLISDVLVPAVRAEGAPSGDNQGNLAIPLKLVPLALADAIAGQGYARTIAAIGGTPPYTFSVAPGSHLPPGFTLDSATGRLINSNPAQNVAGTYTFFLTVTDSAHPANVATHAYKLQVVVPTPLKFTFTSLPNGQVGQAYSFTATAIGGAGPYVWTVTKGTLPYGLFLTSGGRILGLPTVAGLSTFTLSVHDSASPQQSISGVFSILVQNTLPITPDVLKDAQVEEIYSVTLQASGGTAPFTWSIVSGALPGGLSLTSGGTLFGAPTEESGPGIFSFTVSVVDSGDPQVTGTRTYTLVVLPDDETTREDPPPPPD